MLLSADNFNISKVGSKPRLVKDLKHEGKNPN